jgi:hypothetical protein
MFRAQTQTYHTTEIYVPLNAEQNRQGANQIADRIWRSKLLVGVGDANDGHWRKLVY